MQNGKITKGQCLEIRQPSLAPFRLPMGNEPLVTALATSQRQLLGVRAYHLSKERRSFQSIVKLAPMSPDLDVDMMVEMRKTAGITRPVDQT